MNSKKRKSYIIITGVLLVFGTILSWNYSTYIGLKNNTGYTYGRIIKIWESGKHKHEYSRYEYQVDRITFQGRQGGAYSKEKLVVVVYDKENPKYSMIAEYPLELINEQNDTFKIEERYVTFSWWNYLPGDNISDIWKK